MDALKSLSEYRKYLVDTFSVFTIQSDPERVKNFLSTNMSGTLQN